MHRFLASVILSLGCVCAFAAGTTESSSIRHASAYGRDDKWWKCNVTDPSKGCDTGPLSALGLFKGEEAYVRGTLDRISWHPQKAKKDEIAKVLKQKASIDVGLKQLFAGAGIGADPNRGVSVYYLDGYVSMIHWFQQGRFLLVKAHNF